MDRNPKLPLKCDFLKTELRLAQTFLNLANQSKDKAKIDRNLFRAWKAHDAAARFIERTALKDDEGAELRLKIAQLELDLRALEKSMAIALSEQLGSISAAKKPRNK